MPENNLQPENGPPWLPWHAHLGDHWASCNYLLTRSWMRREVIQLVEEHPRLREILALLDGPERSRVVLVPRDAMRRQEMRGEDVWASPYWPTKTTWSPLRQEKDLVACHFDGVSSAEDKNPSAEDRARIETWASSSGLRLVHLDGSMTLAQMVETASRARLFLGVDSGPSHVCHSVGVPMFLVEYRLPVITAHRKKQFVHCHGTDQLLEAVSCFLRNESLDVPPAAVRKGGILAPPGYTFRPR